LLENCYHKQLM